MPDGQEQVIGAGGSEHGLEVPVDGSNEEWERLVAVWDRELVTEAGGPERCLEVLIDGLNEEWERVVGA